MAFGRPLRASRLTPLEIATHVLAGNHAPAQGALESVEPAASPVAALEASLRDALQRPPCVVAFSGGRDSSVLLALAARVARREGLDDPIPATLRHPSLPRTCEDEWQELVLAHLGVENWERRTFEDELDVVGPVAQELMRRKGLTYPYNLHLQVPLMEIAGAGSLVMGLGGDEAFTPSPRIWSVLMGRTRPRRRDVLPILAEFAPSPLRRALHARRPQLTMPWLLPAANRRLGDEWLEQDLRIPLRWDRRLRHWWRLRYIQIAIEEIVDLGASFGVRICQPFVDPRFVAALARDVGPRGFDGRDAVLERLFGDALPVAVTRRTTKALFNDVLWNRHARALAGDLSGESLEAVLRHLGVHELVDARALEQVWSRAGSPSENVLFPNSFLLLQGAWLALNGIPQPIRAS